MRSRNRTAEHKVRLALTKAVENYEERNRFTPRRPRAPPVTPVAERKLALLQNPFTDKSTPLVPVSYVVLLSNPRV
jgi:hypothetical protein